MSILDYLGFSQNPLQDISNGFIKDNYLKDEAHASKLMRPDDFALAPNLKFLFHVYFTLNVPSSSNDTGLVGALVKSVQLPSFKLNTEEHIQYNRKRLVHNRIDYNPVSIVFHDDSSDTVRSMWYNYYKYYFADSRHKYDQGAAGYNRRDVYDPNRPVNDWGYTPASAEGRVKPAFFKDIKIYGMSRKNFVLYTLINPMIDSWQHDKYDYADGGGVMEHIMNVKYEAVKYSSGTIGTGGNPILGFADPSRYDNSPSPLGGSSGKIGSILEAPGDIFGDLENGNILGAIKKGKTIFDIAKNGNIGDIVRTEVIGKVREGLPGAIKSVSNQVKSVFPKSPDPTQNTTTNVQHKINTPKTSPTISESSQKTDQVSQISHEVKGRSSQNKVYANPFFNQDF